MIQKEYKYWLYYLDKELYAYTDNKVYAEKFEAIRDMDKFKKEKYKISREDVNYLAKEYQELILEPIEFTIDNKDTGDKFTGELIVTRMEKITMSNISVQLLEEERYKHCWILNPVIFKKKIYKALKQLMYVDSFKYISNTEDLDDIMGIYEEDEPCKLEPDYLGIFLRYYGNTIRSEFV
jgi:hypothetical protein